MSISIGDKFGRLTVIKKTEKRTKNGTIIWQCECDCGNEFSALSNSLLSGHTKSCGCLNRDKMIKRGYESKKNIELGSKFGKWTVLKEDP